MQHWIIGSFNDRDAAETAVEKLSALGYGREDISIIMNDDTRSRYFGSDTADTIAAPDRGASAAKGAAAGGMLGGTIGAIVAAVVGTGAVGLTVATAGAAAPFIAGPIAAVLAAGGAGAAAGSVLGGLVGAGFPEADAKRVDEDVTNGSIVVSVKADDADAGKVRHILERHAA